MKNNERRPVDLLRVCEPGLCRVLLGVDKCYIVTYLYNTVFDGKIRRILADFTQKPTDSDRHFFCETSHVLVDECVIGVMYRR